MEINRSVLQKLESATKTAFLIKIWCAYVFSNNMAFAPQRQAPAINWLDSLKTAFYPLSLSKDDHVLLHNLPYIAKMSRIVNNWLNKQETKNRYSETIKTWRWWCFSIFLTLSFCHFAPLSDPLHTFMIFNLLHTLMPAMDSRFSQTARNFSLALGQAEEVRLIMRNWSRELICWRAFFIIESFMF